MIDFDWINKLFMALVGCGLLATILAVIFGLLLVFSL